MSDSPDLNAGSGTHAVLTAALNSREYHIFSDLQDVHADRRRTSWYDERYQPDITGIPE